MNKIYMDHSATTPVSEEVISVIIKALQENWGNPSSLHSYGKDARRVLESARNQVAMLVGATPQEIIFTSGGTEANNYALLGSAWAHQKRGRHLITTQIEHPAVLNSVDFLERNGFEITYLPVDRFGQINLKKLEEEIRKDTILISIMHANNEIGTIQPLLEIAEIAKARGIVFHSDAVQTVGRIPVDVKELKVDLLALSAHKFYGPKGIGALYVKSGTTLSPITYGGGQERKWRSGTENIPGIVGMGKAAEMAREDMQDRFEHIKELSEYLSKKILNDIPHAYLSGHPEERLAGHTSFIFPGVDGATLLALLDAEGIATSGASACSSNSFTESHVLKATGLKKEFVNSALRLSLGKDNSFEDLEKLMKILPELVERQRLLSTLI